MANPFSEFKKFCIEINEKDKEQLEELDWYAMSIGFFIAKGCDIDRAKKFAVKARYDCHYWQ